MNEKLKFICSIAGMLCVALLIIYISFETKSTTSSEQYMNTIQSYNYIIINGEQYNTSDIESLSYHPSSYTDDVIEIILVDGTMVQFSINNYTLKK